MSSMFEVIRKIVNHEMQRIHVTELGVVTSIFPHSSNSDKENYECNVKLKYRDLELRKVPVATQHIGLAHIPNVGDLVLITFVNGNVNAPVIIGRLYTDEDRPPVSKEEEIVYNPPYSQQSGLRRVHLGLSSGVVLSITDDDVTVEAGKTIVKLNRDGDIDIESSAKLNVKATGDLSFSAANITIESQQTLEIKAGATAEINATGPLTIKGAMVNINP
jgi:phage baseplate assembly protein gpV